MSQITRKTGNIRAPDGDGKAVPPDISKGQGTTENNKDFGAVNVDVQGVGPTTTFETTARTMPRRRSRAKATPPQITPARKGPPQELMMALEQGEQLDAQTLFALIQELLRYRWT